MAICIWLISLVSVAGVLFRPRQSSEWVWASGGACLLVATTLISSARAISAIADGTSVYFFLVGMMILSELAREEGLFDWLAAEATRRAGDSNFRLFVLIYLAGIFTTVFLSLDATAVVLTPAVLAAAKKAGAKPTVHLFACAMISNAASFVLPISNPANLVLYGGTPPSIIEWLRSFTLPSFAAIGATFLVLAFWFRRDFSVSLPQNSQNQQQSESPTSAKLNPGALGVAAGLGFVVSVMLIYSYLGQDFGLPAFVAALVVAVISCAIQRKSPIKVARKISWSVIPLVAGLFVIVAALIEAGSRDMMIRSFTLLAHLTPFNMMMTGGFGVGILSNLLNNLPVGLMVGSAVKSAEVSLALRKAMLLGVDLGPNLSVTGSLATILWLLAIRRGGENVRARDFFKVGLLAMPIAMLFAIMALLF